MKVELRKDGTLYVKAETDLESYALSKWAEDYPFTMNEEVRAWLAVNTNPESEMESDTCEST